MVSKLAKPGKFSIIVKWISKSIVAATDAKLSIL